MKTPEMASSSETPLSQDLSQDLLHAARYYLGGRRGLIALAVLIAVAGAALNWSWLVALGVAPLLLSLAPCLAMCALGLCMTRMAGQSCSAGTDAARSAAPAAPPPHQALPAVAADVGRVEPIPAEPARPENRTAADGVRRTSHTQTPDERK
jgi:hypothetical protein